MEEPPMKMRIKKVGLYHYNLYKKGLFGKQEIGTATISLDGKRIDLNMSEKWWAYARSIGEYIEKDYILHQEKKETE